MDKRSVVVVGGGPAGYVCARRLGQLGVETILVEAAHLGGVCLNEGCIPTKSLYAATNVVGRVEALAKAGVHVAPRIDLDALRDWESGIITSLRSGVEKLLTAVNVDIVRGRAQLAGSGKVRVTEDGEEREIAAEAIVLATGAVPIELPGIPFDGERVWSSWDALRLPRVPERLVVVGGGVIGLEMATVYRRLGSEVTVLEMTDGLLPGLGLSRRGHALLRQALTQQGIEVMLGAAAQELTEKGVRVRTEQGEQEIAGDAVLVAVGRRPRSEDLGLETVGIELEQGTVPTDEHFQAADGVYAIGDLRGGWQLAHKASHEGLLLAHQLAARTSVASELVSDVHSELVTDVRSMLGSDATIRGHVIPQAVFTQPEVALVGVPVDEASRQGGKVGRFPMAALGRALAEGEPFGHVILASDAEGRLLGAEIVGPHASDLIAEATLAIQHGLTTEQLAATIHAHPTFPEGLWESTLALLDRPLHSA